MTKTSTHKKTAAFGENKENLWTSVNYSPEFIYLQSTYDSTILNDTGIPKIVGRMFRGVCDGIINSQFLWLDWNYDEE